MKLLRWLRRPSFSHSVEDHSIDVAQLDHSMHLLRTTTAEVSQAAVDAARVLGDQLQDAEARFNSTIDHVTDLIIVKDGEGRWKKVNRVGQEVFNWHHGEFYNKTDSQLASTYPIYKNTLDTCKITDQIAWDQQRPYRGEEFIPDGKCTKVFDVIKTPVFNDDGTPKELIVIGRDVTEIRERQRRTKACFHALNSASDVIAIVDNECNIFFCNDKFIEAFKVGSYNNCVHKPLESIVGPINKKMWQTVTKNKSWKGSFGQYDLSVFPMMNGEPKPIYHVCTFKKAN